MDVANLDGWIIFEEFPQFGDEDIHAAGGEIAVVAPDSFEGHLARQQLVAVFAEQQQQRRLFRTEQLFGFAIGVVLSAIMILCVSFNRFVPFPGI